MPFDQLREREENLRLLALAVTRLAADTGRRHTLDDVISGFGYTSQEIDEAED